LCALKTLPFASGAFKAQFANFDVRCKPALRVVNVFRRFTVGLEGPKEKWNGKKPMKRVLNKVLKKVAKKF